MIREEVVRILRSFFIIFAINILLLNIILFPIAGYVNENHLNDSSRIGEKTRSNENILIINVSEDQCVQDGIDLYQSLNYLSTGKRFTSWGEWLTWLKFDLSSLPDSVDITSAILKLNLNFEYDSTNNPIYVYYSSNDLWSEVGITGTNYPGYSQEPTDFNNGPFSTNQWYSWNITKDVANEVKNDNTLTLILKNNDQVGEKQFIEKEADSGKAAFIEVKYKTVSNINVILTNGHGNGTEIYAGYQNYSLNALIKSFTGPDTFDSIIIHFDHETTDIQIKWERVTDEITELNDIYDYISVTLLASEYSNKIWNLNLSIYFKLNYPAEKLSNVKMDIYDNNNIIDSDIYKDIFIVRKNLVLTGNVQVNGGHQGPLGYDSWVRAGEELTFSGLKVVYESDNERSPKENTCRIKISDDPGNSEFVFINSGGNFELSITAEVTTNSYNNYHFSIIPATADKTSIAPFRLRVDAMSPGVPANFKIHADSILETSTASDNDDEIYLSWSSAVETGSGVKGYYYGKVGSMSVFTTDTNGQISGLDEGIHNFEVYAEDNVGNIGEKNTASIIIDLTSPIYSNYYPDDEQWINKTPLTHSITINDIDGSGIDTKKIEYSILKSGSDEWGTWQEPDKIINTDNDTIITAKKELTLHEGNDNFIKWRVTDRAGNGPVESEAFRIMVDTRPVVFSGFSPSNSEKRNTTVNITLQDTSGILLFEYRLKFTGNGDYSPWQTKDIYEFDNLKTVSIPMELPFGNTHRIQFRASDIAGNGMVLSDEYQIKINSIPNVVITSPDPALTYYTSDMILFDASGTNDEDNDTLKYLWESDINGELRRTPEFQQPLKYGTHKITLRVSDGGGHIVNVSFDLDVLPVDTDGDGLDDSEDSDDDGDGMPDYWEYLYGLDPLKNDAQADKDGDGYTNKEEYNAGTDPSDKDSHPKGLSSSMVSTIVILVVVMLVIIIAMGIGFIIYRRNVKKRLIVPEIVSKPGVPGGAVLPGGVPTSGALPGATASTQAGISLPGQTISAQRHQYLLPEHKMNPEEILYQLDQRLALGEISEETYKELKTKYGQPPVHGNNVLKKKKIKKYKEETYPPQEQGNNNY